MYRSVIFIDFKSQHSTLNLERDLNINIKSWLSAGIEPGPPGRERYDQTTAPLASSYIPACSSTFAYNKRVEL